MRKQLLAQILGVSCLLGPSAAAQSGVMSTEAESLDGNQRDMAGPTDVTTLAPIFERVYAAQGRRMAQFIVSTRDRQFFGELSNFPTDLAAVEVDEARDLMFLLTNNTNTGEPGVSIPGELQVYDISTASSPVQTDAEPVTGVDIRVVPQDEKLLLIQGQKVIVYDYHDPFSLTQVCESETLATADLSVTCGSEPTRDVTNLLRAVVQVDGSTRRVFLAAPSTTTGFPWRTSKAPSESSR